MARRVAQRYALLGVVWLALGATAGYGVAYYQQQQTQQRQQKVSQAQQQMTEMGRIISLHQRFRTILHIENSNKIGKIGSFEGFTTGSTRLLLVVHYDVLAGVDLQQGLSLAWDETAEQLVVAHHPAQIFEVNADHKSIEQLVSFSRMRAVSLQDFLPAIAEHGAQIIEDAQDAGVLGQATHAAQKVMRRWLGQQGWHAVRFEVVSR